MKSAAALAALYLLVARAAGAAPCGQPDLKETLPADGATDLPVNARLSARYAATAEYVDEEVTLEHVGFETEAPRATFDSSEGFLGFVPSSPLVAGDSYVVRWPGLRGLSTAVVGKGAEVKFAAGAGTDVDPPGFLGVRSLTWDVERMNDDCTDSLEDRFVFDLSLYDATDDGGRGLLTLVVFQTKGGSAATSPAPVLVQRFSDSGSRVRVERSIDAAVGDVCFAALARDSLGRISSSADREVCVTTVRPPFFYGCAVSSARAGRGGELIALLVFAGLARHRTRQRPRRA